MTATHQLSHYYKFQSKIYDLTRWSFLFGRQLVVDSIPAPKDAPLRILEVGCGTGSNLVRLARRFPQAEIVGIDLSADMLAIARKKLKPFHGRVTTVQGAFGDTRLRGQFNVVLFSYCLTMVNPGWEGLLAEARQSLVPDGILAVVDFHQTQFTAFGRHMAGHHVRMEGHILPELEAMGTASFQEVGKAYGGIWEWMVWVGRV